MSDKNVNERNAFSSCFSSAQQLICLYHLLRLLRCEILEKKGELLLHAEPAHCLEILQSIRKLVVKKIGSNSRRRG